MLTAALSHSNHAASCTSMHLHSRSRGSAFKAAFNCTASDAVHLMLSQPLWTLFCARSLLSQGGNAYAVSNANQHCPTLLPQAALQFRMGKWMRTRESPALQPPVEQQSLHALNSDITQHHGPAYLTAHAHCPSYLTHCLSLYSSKHVFKLSNTPT